ncbi:hypothetical protein DB31_7817 [Hyalangium minutum]|uniref:Uncharacterized protein n=1 Tax=Hyalangium minutum TaxID=394096 RepID=A0A085WLL7_9BACT|nr:hypothetical protein DB31_7817 [Hyalangium minutum]
MGAALAGRGARAPGAASRGWKRTNHRASSCASRHERSPTAFDAALSAGMRLRTRLRGLRVSR